MVLFYAAGYYLLFTFSELHLKEEMKEMIRTGELADYYAELTFPAHQFEQMKMDEHEFVYEGERFDIVSVRTAGDDVVVTCVQDAKESSLLRNAISCLDADYSSAPKPTAANNTVNLLKLLQTFFVMPAAEHAPVTVTGSLLFASQIPIYQIPCTVLYCPPPEHSLSRLFHL